LPTRGRLAEKRRPRVAAATADKRQAGLDAVLETAKRFIDDHVRNRR